MPGLLLLASYTHGESAWGTAGQQRSCTSGNLAWGYEAPTEPSTMGADGLLPRALELPLSTSLAGRGVGFLGRCRLVTWFCGGIHPGGLYEPRRATRSVRCGNRVAVVSRGEQADLSGPNSGDIAVTGERKVIGRTPSLIGLFYESSQCNKMDTDSANDQRRYLRYLSPVR
ncbi:hypothetical protein VTK73DRAFT_1543 [Phialemonium thermophilum]|uniref:Uncharacterized protein n=1 Tax=Phialemonium thermophilum TaxID=223376 RepID=A0ABR3VTA3_9PEZI